MRAKRDLQPAAQGHSMHRRDDRLGACLNVGDHVGQAWALRRFAELGYVRAADEHTSSAEDHRDVGVVVRLEPGEGFGQTAPDIMGQGVDRRIFHRHYRYPVFDLIGHRTHRYAFSFFNFVMPNSAVTGPGWQGPSPDP
mmetsp:Transcript_7339/g.9507  ORF Transcript_7339/g.9507 Transcript_7339/m.9507 type:complete len:139 (-) Transcript_7339:183-599(-)